MILINLQKREDRLINFLNNYDANKFYLYYNLLIFKAINGNNLKNSNIKKLLSDKAYNQLAYFINTKKIITFASDKLKTEFSG